MAGAEQFKARRDNETRVKRVLSRIGVKRRYHANARLWFHSQMCELQHTQRLLCLPARRLAQHLPDGGVLSFDFNHAIRRFERDHEPFAKLRFQQVFRDAAVVVGFDVETLPE